MAYFSDWKDKYEEAVRGDFSKALTEIRRSRDTFSRLGSGVNAFAYDVESLRAFVQRTKSDLSSRLDLFNRSQDILQANRKISELYNEANSEDRDIKDIRESSYDADRKRRTLEFYAEHQKEYGFHNLNQAEEFRRDSLDDFTRRLEDMTAHFGGDKDIAEKKLRMEVLKNFPDFFKNSKLSTRTLYDISTAAKSLPGVGQFMAHWQKVSGMGPLGMGANAVMAGISLAQKFIDIMRANSQQKIKETTHAIAGGMDPAHYVSADSVLKAYGGSGEADLAVTRNWKSNVGRLMSGTGDTGFLQNLAVYGIDISGSGLAGLATDKEIKTRVARQVKQLYDSGEEEKAMALSQAAGFDESMFRVALRFGGGINKYLGYNEDLAKLALEGEEDDIDTEVGTRTIYLGGRSIKNQIIKGFTNPDLAASGNILAVPGIGVPVRTDLGAEKVKAADDAAQSLQNYEESKWKDDGSAPASEPSSGGDTNIEIGEIVVQANDYDEMVDSIKREGEKHARLGVMQRTDRRYV